MEEGRLMEVTKTRSASAQYALGQLSATSRTSPVRRRPGRAEEGSSPVAPPPRLPVRLASCVQCVHPGENSMQLDSVTRLPRHRLCVAMFFSLQVLLLTRAECDSLTLSDVGPRSRASRGRRFVVGPFGNEIIVPAPYGHRDKPGRRGKHRHPFDTLTD